MLTEGEVGGRLWFAMSEWKNFLIYFANNNAQGKLRMWVVRGAEQNRQMEVQKATKRRTKVDISHLGMRIIRKPIGITRNISYTTNTKKKVIQMKQGKSKTIISSPTFPYFASRRVLTISHFRHPIFRPTFPEVCSIH